MCRFAQTQLPASPSAPGAARRFVKEACDRWGLVDLADDLALLVSELVTNAVLHAASRSILTVSVAEGTVEVSVADSAAAQPVLRAHRSDLLSDLDAIDPDAPADDGEIRSQADAVGDAGSVYAGRGLQLVDAIAYQWGTALSPIGKAIWLTLDAPESWPPQRDCVCAQSPTHRTASGHAVAHMSP